MKKPKILIIENEADLAESISDFLTVKGFETAICLSGEFAIENMMAESPDVIICDLMMHGMDGYDVLEVVKGMKKFEHTPFLFLTGKAEEENRRKGMIQGADDFITKPFKYDTLIGSINAALEKSNQRKKKIKELSEEVASQFESISEINFLTNHEVRSNLSKILQTLNLIKTNSMTFEEGMPILNQSAAEIDRVASQINDLIAKESCSMETKNIELPVKCNEVVLVDDDHIQMTLNKMIVQKSLKPDIITTFTSGEEAIKYLKNNRADLMFLDINMPGMSGIDVLEVMKNLEISLPVIMLSSSMDPKQINCCYSYPNVAKYMIKPLKPAGIQYLIST